MEEFELAIIENLNTITTTRRYMGELSERSGKVDLLQNEISNMPLILFDFVGTLTKKAEEDTISFNLYLIHIALAKHVKLRLTKEYELYELIKKIRTSVNLRQFTSTSGVVELISTEKLDDVVSDDGFLSVYSMHFNVDLRF